MHPAVVRFDIPVHLGRPARRPIYFLGIGEQRVGCILCAGLIVARRSQTDLLFLSCHGPDPNGNVIALYQTQLSDVNITITFCLPLNHPLRVHHRQS